MIPLLLANGRDIQGVFLVALMAMAVVPVGSATVLLPVAVLFNRRASTLFQWVVLVAGGAGGVMVAVALATVGRLVDNYSDIPSGIAVLGAIGTSLALPVAARLQRKRPAGQLPVSPAGGDVPTVCGRCHVRYPSRDFFAAPSDYGSTCRRCAFGSGAKPYSA